METKKAPKVKEQVSDNVELNGHIVITDPMYVDGLRNEYGQRRDLWRKSNIDLATGKGIEKFGFTSFVWGGTSSDGTFDVIESENPIGQASTDSRLIGVFLLDEVLAHNPDFQRDYLANPKLATVIKDFKGEVAYTQTETSREISSTKDSSVCFQVNL